MTDDQEQAIPTAVESPPTPAADQTQSAFGGSSALPTSDATGESTFGGTPGPQPAQSNPQSTFGGQGPGAQPPQGDPTQRLKAYFSNDGAMPQEQYAASKQQLVQGGMDPNDATVALINQHGAPALKAARANWDAGRGAAAKAIADGNFSLAAAEANKAFQNVPDGTQAMATAGRDSLKITVHTPNGGTNSYNLNPEEAKQVFVGAHGLFDHVVGQGVAGTLSSVAAAKGPGGGEFGGPPEGTQETSKGTAETGGAPASSFKEQGPNQEEAPPAAEAAKNAGKKGLPPQNPARWKSEQGGIGHFEREPTFTNPDEAPEGSRPGENEPITINRRGKTQTVGNATPPEGTSATDTQLARQAEPNNPEGQAKFLTTQRQQAEERANKLETAKNTRLYGSQAQATARTQAEETRAQGGIQQAQIKADAVAQGTDKRFEGEQGRDAANILKQMMHDNPGAPIGDQIKALRAGNISEGLIRHLVNPSAPAPQARPAQPAPPPAQGTQSSAPAVAAPQPTIVNQQTGQRMQLQGGKWTPIP